MNETAREALWEINELPIERVEHELLVHVAWDLRENFSIRALGAPQRRRILRILHEVGEARSPNELSEAFETSVGHVSYHVKVLKECGALALTDTQPRRGALEHYYGSTVSHNELVVKFLESTRTEDDE